MRSGLAAVLALASVASAQTAAPPVLSVELGNAITQPGNLRLIRPLVLFISDWSGDKPRARAWTDTGTVTADITRQPGTPGHWNAAVQVHGSGGLPGAQPGVGDGDAAGHLSLHGTTRFLDRSKERFRDLQIHGNAQAGLTWDFVDPNDDKGDAALAARSGPSGKGRAVTCRGAISTPRCGTICRPSPPPTTWP